MYILYMCTELSLYESIECIEALGGEWYRVLCTCLLVHVYRYMYMYMYYVQGTRYIVAATTCMYEYKVYYILRTLDVPCT